MGEDGRRDEQAQKGGEENVSRPITDDGGDQAQTGSNSDVGAGGADDGVRLEPDGELVKGADEPDPQ